MKPRGGRVGRILADEGSVAVPGVFDPLSALIAQQAGFALSFVSGYSVAATFLGEPDLGLLTQTEVTAQAARICRRVEIPILVDADTGYGNPLNVVRTVHDLMAAGAAGCFLEDQVWPKRCGHMAGKQIVGRDEYFSRIRAAVDARGDRDFFIVARTDALAVSGLEEALTRVAGARAAGADASFIEAPDSRELLLEIGRRSPAPNVANMIEGGRTPVLSRDELAELGFQLILYPLAGLFAASWALQSVFQQLRDHGTTTGSRVPQLDFAQFNALIGLAEKERQLQRWAPDPRT